jgi:hypothetical protein
VPTAPICSSANHDFVAHSREESNNGKFTKGGRMKIAHNHVTMDGEELQLLERYEEQFGETPPIYFLAPETSKRMIIDALRRNRPFNEEDLESESDFALIRRTVNAGIAAKTSNRQAPSKRGGNSKRRAERR